MIIGAAAEAAGAASQLYQSLVGKGQTATDQAYQAAATTADPSTASQSTAPTTATQSPISQAASKLITDLNALLLNLQAANGASTSSTTTPASTQTTDQSTSTDAATTLEQSLQTVAKDLQQAGATGHHHHHHHHSDASSQSGGTDASTQLGSTNPGPAGGSLFAQVSQALSAYTSANAATPSASTALLTA